ncbi:AfsR/SARP family transcriptional regulator [Micromonospora sp. M12]
MPSEMRYRLLGPVEARSVAGERLALGTPMQVRLLAVLMSQPGTGWSIDQLVDELWQGRPPKTAAGNVKTYVWALRRTLRSPALPTRHPRRGHRLPPRGRRADDRQPGLRRPHPARPCRPATGPPVSRPRGVRGGSGAVAWGAVRGPPGSGVLLAVRTRLQDQRSSLLEEIADLHLHAGRHHELIEPLRTQVDGDPLRERPWGQLMVALARSGRRADALATYRQVRRLLCDEVGVEPGPDLQHLHTRILRADRELLTTETRRAEEPTPRIVPGSCPPHRRCSPAGPASWPGSRCCCSATPSRPAPSSSPAPAVSGRPGWRCAGRTTTRVTSPTGSSTSTSLGSAPRRRRRRPRPSSYARSCPPWASGPWRFPPNRRPVRPVPQPDRRPTAAHPAGQRA